MPNKYYYNGTLPEQIAEEDREVGNDLMRAQTDYYETLNKINSIILAVLLDIDEDELIELVKSGNLNPVSRL